MRFVGWISCALILVVPAFAFAQPARVVANQPGLVRQVEQGDRYIAWTRCVTPRGPTEVWVAPRTRGSARRVPGIRVAGACQPVHIVGTYRHLVVTLITTSSGLRRLDAIDIRTGRRQLIDIETRGEDGDVVRFADMVGSRIVWIRETGQGRDRISQTVVGDLRNPVRDGRAGWPRRVYYIRSLEWNPVVPTGVWIAPDGAVFVREAIQGVMYGYGQGSDRLVQVNAFGFVRHVVRPGDGGRIVGVDISRRHIIYTLGHDATGRTWTYLWDRRAQRRTLVVLVRRPTEVPEASPSVPVAHIDTSRVTWRERRPTARGFMDRVLVRPVGSRRVRVVARIDDVRGQRIFQTAPALVGRRVAWAQIRMPRAAGPRGGFDGRGARGSRSHVLTRLVR